MQFACIILHARIMPFMVAMQHMAHPYMRVVHVYWDMRTNAPSPTLHMDDHGMGICVVCSCYPAGKAIPLVQYYVSLLLEASKVNALPSYLKQTFEKIQLDFANS
jgi:hypothetical protein